MVFPDYENSILALPNGVLARFGAPAHGSTLPALDAADAVVVAAPYWDLSFPAQLKIYIENIYATGIVTRYGADGRPEGMCRAEELIYVTTSGGPFDGRFGYGYVKALAEDYFGIPATRLLLAEGLDIQGNDPEAILQKVMAENGLTEA